MGNWFSSPPKMCQEWYRLKCPCPACDSVEVHTWVHGSNCKDGDILINSDAYTKCEYHTTPAPLANCRWDCGNHHGEYRPSCTDALIYSLTIAAGISQSAGNKIWAKKLIKSIAQLKA